MKRLERLLIFLRVFPTWRPIRALRWVRLPRPNYFGRARDFAGAEETIDAPFTCPQCGAFTEVQWPLWYRAWRCSSRACRWPYRSPKTRTAGPSVELAVALILLVTLSGCDMRFDQLDPRAIEACSKACLAQSTWMRRVTADACECTKPGVTP